MYQLASFRFKTEQHERGNVPLMLFSGFASVLIDGDAVSNFDDETLAAQGAYPIGDGDYALGMFDSMELQKMYSMLRKEPLTIYTLSLN